jgi:hypothetical protein
VRDWCIAARVFRNGAAIPPNHPVKTFFVPTS